MIPAPVSVEGLCPGCGNRYTRAEAALLYSDERGCYCHDCGGLLVAGVADRRGGRGEREPVLAISERLEGSELHRRLKDLAGGVGVLVDRTGEVRTLALREPGASPVRSGRRGRSVREKAATTPGQSAQTRERAVAAKRG